MGVRLPDFRVTEAREEAATRAVAPYRSVLREVRHVVSQADEGLIGYREALHLIDRAAARELGEGHRG